MHVRNLALALLALIVSYTAAANLTGETTSAAAAEWITAPSRYTHDPQTAERVEQYTAIGPYYYYQRPDYQQSGYRHNRSTFQFGNSADNLHIVETWGAPVRPYDEWRFPFRPYSVPYSGWGAPYAGLGGFGYGGLGGGYGPGGGGPGVGGPGVGGPGGGGGPGFGGGPYNTAQPQTDGHWPTYNRHDRSDYYRPYSAQPGIGF